MLDKPESKIDTSNSLPEEKLPSAMGNSAEPSKPPASTLKKKSPLNVRMVLGLAVLVLTVVGGVAGYYLTQTAQDIRQQAAEDPYNTGGDDQVCCTFNNNQTFSKADRGICQANGTQVEEAKCSNTGSGTQSCPNGQTHLSRRCDGNATRTCINGQYSIAECSPGYSCYNGNCILETGEFECAGGVPDGATACLDNTTQVTCNNGAYANPQGCASGEVCTQGRCQTIVGDPGVANCDPNETNPSASDYCGIYGNLTGTCESNTWNIYECDSVNTSSGCHQRVIGTTSTSGVSSYLAATGSCKTRQADCVNGSSSDFRSRVNNTGNCSEVIPTPSPSPIIEITPSPLPSVAPSPSPDNPSSPNPSPNPSSSPNYFCNSTCSSDSQCQSADSDFICSEDHGNRCRLDTNPSSSECQPPVGPMCLSLSLTNISNPTAGTDDPELGDAVNFTCGLVNGAERYIFRVIEPDDTIVDLDATGATSEQYTITKDGMHYAQCQICTGADDSTCHAYEDPFN